MVKFFSEFISNNADIFQELRSQSYEIGLSKVYTKQ